MKDVALADIADGFATGPFGSAVSAKNFVSSGVPMIRGSNLSLDIGHRLVEDDMVFVPAELATQYPRALAREGDLVFTCWGTVGQIGYLDGTARFDEYLVSNKQMKLTPMGGVVDSRFLYYCLSQPHMIRTVTDSAIGSSVPGFNLGQLRSLRFSLPDLATQRGVAEVLGALDDKIAANDSGVAVAGELGAAFFRGAYLGETRPLSTVAEVIMGSSPKGETLNEVGHGVVFQQGVRDFGVRSPGRRIWTTSPIRMAEEGDTLVSVRAPVGLVNVAREPLCVGRGLAAVRSTESTPWTLFHALRSMPEVWEPFEATGTVFGSITGPQIKALDVPVICHDAATVERRLAALELRIASWLVENTKLAALRDALLPELMSGRLTVKDAESQVEEVV